MDCSNYQLNFSKVFIYGCASKVFPSPHVYWFLISGPFSGTVVPLWTGLVEGIYFWFRQSSTCDIQSS